MGQALVVPVFADGRDAFNRAGDAFSDHHDRRHRSQDPKIFEKFASGARHQTGQDEAPMRGDDRAAFRPDSHR